MSTNEVIFAKMNTKFSSLLIKTDVTAIKTTNDFIFAAIGSHVHIFEKCDYRFIRKIRVFDGKLCCGIEFNDVSKQLLIYGENKIKIFDCKHEIFEVCKHSAKDWIITAKWAADGAVVALTMHNVLIVYNNRLEEKRKCICEENCILYSGFVCYDVFGQLLVFSGTVFSETLIWRPEREFCSVLSRLKGHKGVIFSITCAPSLGLICTTSDDRTAMLWKTTIFSSKEPQKSVLLCTVNGHTSRIFRCLIIEDVFATAGEDSLVNIWNFEGELVKKIVANTGDSVWALDFDENSENLLIGNGNGSVIAVKLKNSLDVHTFELEKVRRVGIFGENNLVLITEEGCLFCFLKQKNQLKMIAKHNQLRSYALLEISHCKKLVALAGFFGDVFIYRKTKDSLEFESHHQISDKGRIFSFHWLTCNLFLTCEKGGDLKLWFLHEKSVVFLTKFVLPPSKERWSTCACLINAKNFVVGDRKGNLHVFRFGKSQAVQTLKKAHSHLGVTFLAADKNTVFSMGRNGLLKTFSFDSKNEELSEKTSDKLPFSWLAKLERFDNKNFLLGFTGKEFLIWDCEERRILLQNSCGGGHRSWDFNKTENSAVFVYLKEQFVNLLTTNWSNLCPVTVVKGFHNLEINALAVVPNQSKSVLLSGGEDTTFQITSFDDKTKIFNTTQTLKSHLSSIRCITVAVLNKISAVFTAGGRGQIIFWRLELENNTIKCQQKCSYYESLQNDESEMRVMDLATIKSENDVILFAACSDGTIKVFIVNTATMKLILQQNFLHRPKCILKITTLVICNQNLVVTMNTEGKITFWNVLPEKFTLEQPCFEIIAHQSGVTSFSVFKITDNLCVFLTGGDDNAIILHVFAFENNDSGFSVTVVCKYVDVSSHCAQITGVFITDGYFITTSIDQKVLVFKWSYCKTLIVDLVGGYNTAIADIQGLQVLGSTNKSCDVILYGKGTEIVRVFLHNKLLE